MARMRSLTEPYIVSRAPDKIAAVVMSTTGATIAWTAVTAIGFISPAYESSAGRTGLLRGHQQPVPQSGSVSPSGPLRYRAGPAALRRRCHGAMRAIIP